MNLQNPDHWYDTAHQLRLNARRVVAYIRKNPGIDHARRWEVVESLRASARHHTQIARKLKRGMKVVITGLTM
jgi:hypothetical protein